MSAASPVAPSLRWRFWERSLRPRLIDQLAGRRDEALQVLFDEAEAGLALVDNAGRLMRVNDALRRMVDCDLSAGRHAAELFALDRREEIWRELGPTLDGRRAPRSFVAALQSQGAGGGLTVRVTATAVREADGTVSGAVVHLANISAQTLLEAQLMHGQRLQAVGSLAEGIAHDFNNLLTMVIGAADDILARRPADDATTEDAGLIRASAERGAALVRQLLAFGRRQAEQPRIVALNDAVQEISGLLKRLLGNQVRVQLQLENPGCLLRLDPTQLDQVLVNLAVNARDAMPIGGELILRTGHITLFRTLPHGGELIPPGRYVTLDVRDTGNGIAPEVLPRIFDLFFTTRRERGGSGIGLATVLGIVRDAGGFLTVDSRVGEGTCFRVYLPRHDAGIVAIPSVPALTKGPFVATNRLVLLVDDEDDIRRLSMRALTNGGWPVLAADSGEAALALLNDENVLNRLGAMVSDMVLPGMDGAALVQEIRRRRPRLPVIITSGYAEEIARAGLELETDVVFLPKPYLLGAMVDAVRRVALILLCANFGMSILKP